jgi:cell division protein FtsB
MVDRGSMPQDIPQMKASGSGAKSGPGAKAAPLQERALIWAQRLWRPAGTAVAVLLALLVTWHVIYGRHGVSVWQQKRAEDRALQQEIKSLQEENEQMRQQVQRLESDPEAIEREAREKLHYTKQGEVVVAMPAQSQGQQPAGR